MYHILLTLACAGVLLACSRIPPTPENAQVRIEAEMIPHTDHRREDYANVHTFVPGEGRLLVISRITSVPTGEKGTTYHDQRIERVWIHLPPVIEPGRAFPLHTLHDWDLAYDEGLFAGQIEGRDAKIAGSLNFTTETDDYAVFDVNLDITPRHRQPWKLKGLLVVPITNTGYHARPYQFGRAAIPVTPIANHPFTHSALPVSLVGQWQGVYHREQRSAYELHLQLDSDGRFVLATGRDAARKQSYDPGMKFGRYRVVGHDLILHVDRYVMGERNENLIERLDNKPLIVLRATMDGDALILTGDWRHPLANRQDIEPGSARLERAAFPDLHTHRPKADRQPGFDPIPESSHQRMR